jgi:hypothetical protein
LLPSFSLFFSSLLPSSSLSLPHSITPVFLHSLYLSFLLPFLLFVSPNHGSNKPAATTVAIWNILLLVSLQGWGSYAVWKYLEIITFCPHTAHCKDTHAPVPGPSWLDSSLLLLGQLWPWKSLASLGIDIHWLSLLRTFPSSPLCAI